MAINLASKYSDQIAEVFTRSSFIKGKTAETFDLTGVKTLKVYPPIQRFLSLLSHMSTSRRRQG